MMHVRPSQAADEAAIRQVHEEAFSPQEGPLIAGLVSELLHDPTAEPCLSLLAEEGARVTGHILFTRVRIAAVASPDARILAPLAVIPEKQQRGTGSALVKEGLSRLTAEGCRLVFVLGYPAYYTRFGFRPAGRLGFQAPYPIPVKDADAWMVTELSPGALLDGAGGVICCADSLNRAEYWVNEEAGVS